MGDLIGLFAAPARLKALLIGVLVMALVCASLLVYGLYWRGEAKAAAVDLTAAVATGTVLADKLGACNAGVDQAKRVGDQAVAAMGELLAAARAANKDRSNVAATLEQLAGQKRAEGEDCRWAWRKIEEEHRKARPAP